jgi:hypothetical protein
MNECLSKGRTGIIKSDCDAEIKRGIGERLKGAEREERGSYSCLVSKQGS